MPILYNLRIAAPGHYQMAKFDNDFNVAAVYDLTAKGQGFACSCPAGLRSVKLKPCKHQRMLPYMLGAVNSNRFYDPELRQWHTPLAIDEPEPREALGPNGSAELPAQPSASGAQVVEPSAARKQPPTATIVRRI